ncbi:VRR-NUC domain-containing protein [Salipaludibacillus sp. HK11]|uniref:VRR-NUC domain-containing protein n=1 Tax=Salipaludibacillus sp. HK11 TaxID=3394320 RepID=UPI0039FCAC59
MLEKDIERKLILEVKKMGGLALKFVSPGFDGMPDRLVLLPNGKQAFVECKAPGKTLRPLQEKRKSQLESLGSLVFCLDGAEQIQPLLSEVMRGSES